MNIHDENYTCFIICSKLRFTGISDFQDLKTKNWVLSYSKPQKYGDLHKLAEWEKYKIWNDEGYGTQFHMFYPS